MSSPSDTPNRKSQTTWEYMTDRRSRRQASMFFLGATFFTFSTLLVKRATIFRQRGAYPMFYKPSNSPPTPINLRAEAAEALALASITAFSGVFMVGGGFLWAFDISSLDDIRKRMGRGAMIQPPPQTQQDADFNVWLTEQLGKRKAQKEAENAKGPSQKK